MRSTPVVVAAVAVPAVVAAVIIGAVLWIVGVALSVALVLVAAAALLVAAWIRLTAAKASLRTLGARPVVAGANPRLDNLVEGICTTHGFREPTVHTVETAAINAASVGMAGPMGHLVVTRGALKGLDRLELEAVVARQFCQMRRGADPATLLASVARLPGGRAVTAPLLGRVLNRRSTVEIDIEAVRLTGYPPALASALDKAARAPSVDGASAATHLWMVIPRGARGADRVQPATVDRRDFLGEV